MLTTVLALTFLTPLPAQDKVLPLLNGYTAQQRQLSDLHYELLLQREEAAENAKKCSEQWNAAHQMNASLPALLTFQRQVIQLIDRSSVRMADTTRRWERAREKIPGPLAATDVRAEQA